MPSIAEEPPSLLKARLTLKTERIRRLCAAFLAAALLVACRASDSRGPRSRTHPFDVAWDDRALFSEGLISAERGVLDQLSGATVYHIDLQIPGDFSLVQGREQVSYTNQEDAPLDEVCFRLFASAQGGRMAVSAVKVDGQDAQPAYKSEESALCVPLPTALQPGGQAVVEMDFELQVPMFMEGDYFGMLGYTSDVLMLDSFYPVIAVYDDEGWNVEVPLRMGDKTYLDASFYLVHVTAPATLTIVASGIEVSRESKADNQAVTFVAGPARDFYLVASEAFTVVSETIGETTVNGYAPEESAQGAGLALRHAVDALRSFSARFGAYPYTEFDVVSTPMLALGMEYPGMTTIATKLYDPAEEITGLPSRVILESAVAHEVGHQWFYNVVGNDQVDEPWLDEAIVQYMTGLYYDDVHGRSAARGCRDSWDSRWDRVDRADIPIGMPAGAYVGKEYGAIVYGRGPLFIAALAEKLGQETFDRFLRSYYESHRWEIGTSDAFKELAERHCQCDLTALFEEWVYEK